MKKTYFFILIPLILLSCSNSNEEVVKSMLNARNEYDFEKISVILDESYQEYFIDGTVEIDNLNQLKEHIEWGKIMDSKVTLKSIKSNDNKIITIEEFSNYQDVILNRKSRTFEITYDIQGQKIFSSIIDTLPGFSKLSSENNEKYQLFEEFCDENNIDLGSGMNTKSAKKLRKALSLYSKVKEN